MKTTVDIYQFRNEFESIRPDNFTYEGLTVLFDYLEQYEEDTGEPLELDVIALCCDYSEMTATEFATDYGYADEFEADQKITLDDAEKYLNDHSIVVGRTDNTIIFANF